MFVDLLHDEVTDASSNDAGMPLDQFSKTTPPGWRPGVAKYPLRRYQQLMSLWWRQTDMPETSVGPAMAGRLRSSAFQFAMALRADRLDVNTGTRREMIGDELLFQPAHDDWTNPIDGTFHAA